MGFHLALGIFLRGVAEGEGVVAEDHRAARSEGLHVQAGIGTDPARPAGGLTFGLNCIPVRFIAVEICFTKQ